MDFFTTEPPETTGEKTLTAEIIGAAMEVHRSLGPGLLESAYVVCLAYELRLRKLKVEQEVSLPIIIGVC